MSSNFTNKEVSTFLANILLVSSLLNAKYVRYLLLPVLVRNLISATRGHVWNEPNLSYMFCFHIFSVVLHGKVFDEALKF